MVNVYFLLFALFFLIEAIIEVVKRVFKTDNVTVIQIVSFLLGGFGSWFLGVSLFEMTGFTPAIGGDLVVTIVDSVLMGVLIIRFSGSAHDLLEWIGVLKNGFPKLE